MNYEPTHANVLLRPKVLRPTGKLILPDGVSAGPEGVEPFEVMAVGPGIVQDGQLIPPCVQVGDHVLVSASHMPMFLDGELGVCVILLDIHITCVLVGFDAARYTHMANFPKRHQEPIQ